MHHLTPALHPSLYQVNATYNIHCLGIYTTTTPPPPTPVYHCSVQSPALSLRPLPSQRGFTAQPDCTCPTPHLCKVTCVAQHPDTILPPFSPVL